MDTFEMFGFYLCNKRDQMSTDVSFDSRRIEMKGNVSCAKCTDDMSADPHNMRSTVRFIFLQSEILFLLALTVTVETHGNKLHAFIRSGARRLHQLDLPPVRFHAPGKLGRLTDSGTLTSHTSTSSSFFTLSQSKSPNSNSSPFAS